MEKNCRNCAYWVRAETNIGTCQRFPPSVNGFPSTSSETHCGEFLGKEVVKEAQTPPLKKTRWA